MDEPVTTLFGTLFVYKVQPKTRPVAWVETLENAQPHCVTDLKYCSVLQHERGEHLKYTPLYKDPTPCQTCESLARAVMADQTSHDKNKEWVGLTDEEIKILFKNSLKNIPAGVIWNISRAIEAKLKEKNT